MMYGIVIIILLIILSGLIAYLGDQIGMKVGKKRISIFGLRPKYSSIIITVITGILIAGLSIAILLTVYGSLREAIFNINKVVVRLENLDEELSQKDKELKNMKKEINTKSDELEKLQSQKTNLESKLTELQKELDLVENELKTTKSELTNTKKELKNTEEELRNTKKELKSAEKNIVSLRENRDKLNKRISELNKQKTKLESKVTSLNEKMSKLTEDYEIASKLANRLGEDMYYYMREDMVYQKGDTIYAKVIEGGQSEDKTINELNQFLTEANKAAKNRPIKVDKDTGMALELQTEDILNTARIIYNMEAGSRVIVSLIARVNVPKDDWLYANFQLYEDFKVFEKGQLISSREISADQNSEQIEAELEALLQEINQIAINQGLLPDNSGQVGSINFSQFYNLVNRVRGSTGRVKINIYAETDIWRQDRLSNNLKFELEDKPAENSAAEEADSNE